MKKLLAGSIERLLQFDNKEEFANYIEKLSKRESLLVVSEKAEGDKYIALVKQSYNGAEFIEDYECKKG